MAIEEKAEENLNAAKLSILQLPGPRRKRMLLKMFFWSAEQLGYGIKKEDGTEFTGA